MNLVSFEDAVGMRPEDGKRSILLGNGFSVACRPNIFRYDAIFDRFVQKLPSSDVDRVSRVFDGLGTRDFESVIRSLRQLAAVAPVYGTPPDIVNALQADAGLIREALVEALAESHPDGPSDIAEGEFKSCARFLSNFSTIYTLNYDLLLYWTVLNQNLHLRLRDGFGEPDIEDEPYVEWELGNETKATVLYLHGALHLFAAGSRVRKVSWCRTGRTLKDQIVEQLCDERFPLFVAEGTAEGKMTTITRHAYLSRAYRSFQSKGGDLFIFGCSLAQSDVHILRALHGSTIRSLTVGIYGEPRSEPNRQLIASCETIAAARSGRGHGRRTKSDLDICYFDAGSAAVWNGLPIG